MHEAHANILWPWQLFTLLYFLLFSFFLILHILFPFQDAFSCSHQQIWPLFINLKCYFLIIKYKFLTSLSSHSFTPYLQHFPVHLMFRSSIFVSPSAFFQRTLHIYWPQILTLAFSVCQGSPPLHLCFFTIYLNKITSLLERQKMFFFLVPLQCSNRCFIEEWRLAEAHSVQIFMCVGWLEGGLTSAQCLVLINIWTTAELFRNRLLFWGGILWPPPFLFLFMLFLSFFSVFLTVFRHFFLQVSCTFSNLFCLRFCFVCFSLFSQIISLLV